MGKIRYVHWIAFFCFFALSSLVHAQTIETTPVTVNYSPFFKKLSAQSRENLEVTLYSSFMAPADHAPTTKEKIDAFIIGNFALAAREKRPLPSLECARAVLYELYDVSSEPLDKLNQEIADLKYDLASDFLSHIPHVGEVISSGMTLKKIQDLKTKKELIQAIDAELPTSVEDVRKAHVLSWKVAKKSSSEFSTQIDAYNFAGNPSAVPILSNLNTLISHNPMTKNQIDLLMASGQVASLEQAVLIVKKNLETVEMIVEQQKNEDEIRTTYLEIRRGSVGVSQILAAFDPHIQNTFNRVVNPLIDMSQSYSALKVASTGGFKLDLTTLSACATGIGAIFALADFFITASQPSEMEILMEHLNGQFEKLHERFDKLHEHMDLVHRDLMRAASELFSVMQQRFDTTDRKLEEIKRVLNRHSEKLKVIEDLIRDQRNEVRNIEMDKDRSDFEEKIRRYEEGLDSFENCLFNCVSYSEITSSGRPHLRDREDDQSDIQNGFFHKVLKTPYFVNLSQLLSPVYPDMPKGFKSKVGEFSEDPINRALWEEDQGKTQEAPFTQADIKNIEVWAEGVNTYLQQALSTQRKKDLSPAQRQVILRHIDQFIVSGKKLKRSLEGIFYHLDSEFEKYSVRGEFVAKVLRDYIGALTQVSESMGTQTSRYETQERISGIDVLDVQAIHTLPESVVVADSPFSPILPSELKAAILLGIGRLSVSYERPRWGVVDGQEGKLLFNVIFKFQEDSQEPKIIGAITIVSDQVISGYSDISPQDALNRIFATDLTTLVISQIKSQTQPTIQRQFLVENDVVNKKAIYRSIGHGKDWEATEKFDHYEYTYGPVQRDKGEPIYPWKGFDLDSAGISAKAEAKRQKHAEKLTQDIVQEIKNENPTFERLEGQKALLEAYLSLGLTQSFTTHVYLKSFFNHIFSHGLVDKEEALYFLSQPENNPRHLLKEGLLRAKKLSCLLLGKTEGCEDDALYSPEGLLAERLNANELPELLNKTLGRLYRAQQTFSVD